jgi:hypothetical protein
MKSILLLATCMLSTAALANPNLRFYEGKSAEGGKCKFTVESCSGGKAFLIMSYSADGKSFSSDVMSDFNMNNGYSEISSSVVDGKIYSDAKLYNKERIKTELVLNEQAGNISSVHVKVEGRYINYQMIQLQMQGKNDFEIFLDGVGAYAKALNPFAKKFVSHTSEHRCTEMKETADPTPDRTAGWSLCK